MLSTNVAGAKKRKLDAVASKSPLSIAAENNDEVAVKTFLQNGGKVDIDTNLDQLFETVSKRGYTPAIEMILQAAIAQNPVEYIDFPVNPKIGETEKVDIQNTIRMIYQDVFEKIKSAKEKAAKNEKPFMILIGESHHKPESIILELIIVMAAHRLGIKTIFNETDYSRTLRFDHQRNEFLKGNASLAVSVWAKQYQMAINSYINMLAHQLGLRVKDADLGVIMNGSIFENDQKYKLVPYENIEPESQEVFDENSDAMKGLAHRNRVMAKVFKKQGSLSILAIVGRMHLKGLVNDEGLANHFELLQFDVSVVSEVFLKMAKEAVNTKLNEGMDMLDSFFQNEHENEDLDGAIRQSMIEESALTILNDEKIEMNRMIKEHCLESGVDPLMIRFEEALATITKHHLPGKLIQLVSDVCSSMLPNDHHDNLLSANVPVLNFSQNNSESTPPVNDKQPRRSLRLSQRSRPGFIENFKDQISTNSRSQVSARQGQHTWSARIPDP